MIPPKKLTGRNSWVLKPHIKLSTWLWHSHRNGDPQLVPNVIGGIQLPDLLIGEISMVIGFETPKLPEIHIFIGIFRWVLSETSWTQFHPVVPNFPHRHSGKLALIFGIWECYTPLFQGCSNPFQVDCNHTSGTLINFASLSVWKYSHPTGMWGVPETMCLMRKTILSLIFFQGSTPHFFLKLTMFDA